MLRKRLAAAFTPLFIITSGGAAFAVPPASSQPPAAERAAQTTDPLTILHSVLQWSITLSEMADERAKSDLVKEYARNMAAGNREKDERLMSVVKKNGIDLAPLNAQTEEGKSLLDRMKAEEVLLSSLQGDAFDKEYMTLVTNTQQSAIQFLKARKAKAKDPETRQLMGDMMTTVQGRLTKAQDIMVKIYGDNI